MYLIELTAVVDPDGTTASYWFADARFATEPGDTPANIAFSEKLLDPGWLSTTAFGDARTGGATALAYGEMIVANGDGELDAWLVGHGFDGQPVTIRQGPPGGAFPSGYPAIFAAACKSIRVDDKQVVVSLRDRALIFDKAFLTEVYDGSNVDVSPPGGFEGTPDDIKAQPKPRLIGGPVPNLAPVCVDYGRQIYQITVGALASVEGVYDGGLAFTFGTDRATKALLAANDPALGVYDTCLAEGFIRLGSLPAGELTADATQGATLADRTAAAAIRALALEAGVAEADLDEASFTALAAANPRPLGLHVTDATTTCAQVLDRFAESVGAAWGFGADGAFGVFRLEAPDAASAEEADFEIRAFEVLAIERRPARDGDIPIWRETVRWGQLQTVQTSGLAGGVDEARRAYLASEWRSAMAEDPDVLTVHALAPAEVSDSLFTEEAHAEEEADRLLALHSVHRDFFDVTVPASLLSTNGVRLGQTAWLTYGRFGLGQGAALIVLGIKPALKDGVALLTLWR